MKNPQRVVCDMRTNCTKKTNKLFNCQTDHFDSQVLISKYIFTSSIFHYTKRIFNKYT
jgi:hypothetical protein